MPSAWTVHFIDLFVEYRPEYLMDTYVSSLRTSGWRVFFELVMI